MRFVFVGTGALAVLTARMLVARGHEVVMIEHDPERIAAVSTELDCGFINGDGTRPALLREVDPEHTDLLFCLTRDDQTNIITSLVARSLGFRRVVTKIEDPDLEHVCAELGLAGSMVPIGTVGRYLADMAEGQDIIALSDLFKGEARVFSFRANAAAAGEVAELDLPTEARVICLYRGERFILGDADTRIEEGDEVVVLTTRKYLHALHERFSSLNA